MTKNNSLPPEFKLDPVAVRDRATTMSTALVVGTKTLPELEVVIQHGLETFINVGLALMEIRTRGLYQETYRSFDTYCRERWGWSKTHANRHIQAAEIGAFLTPIGVILPNEAVARELAPLVEEPEQVREAWDSVVRRHGPKPTALEVRGVVGTIRPHKERRPAAREPGHKLDIIASSFENCAEGLMEVVSEVPRADPRRAGWVAALLTVQGKIGSAISFLEHHGAP